MLGLAGTLLALGIVGRWVLPPLVGAYATVLILGLIGAASGTLVVVAATERCLYGGPRDY